MKTYTNPQFPGKMFRRLEVGEEVRQGDWIGLFEQTTDWAEYRDSVGVTVPMDQLYRYYREISKPDPSALMLQRIEQKLDSALAKLNA
jgi:uncharacterized membrane protein